MNKLPELLTRDRFRETVLARHGGRCAFCDAPAADAHHIIERRLWHDGGYYLDNGAAVCDAHHMACEETRISVEDTRLASGITRIVVPQHLYPDQRYDKWGNPVLDNNLRTRGELFYDESVQKVLAGSLHLFTDWVRYPRTHHLPWSASLSKDDRVLATLTSFTGRRVIVTEKMDGETATLYPDYYHARSVDGRSHPSQDWVKQYRARIGADIPQGWRLCGENLFATHSIRYTTLPTYFMGFSLWNERNVCLSWDETMEYFALMGVTPVPVLYDGVFDERLIRALWTPDNWDRCEGYVVRIADAFSYGDFRHVVGKFVRPGHIQTRKHWPTGQRMVRNHLAT